MSRIIGGASGPRGGNVHARDPTRGGSLTAAVEPSCYSRLTNEWICGQYVVDRQDEIVDATVEHLLITVAAVAFGVLIAFPLALLARRYPRLESTILGVSTGLYTIPSLALFPLLVPFTGLSPTTVVIGLGALRAHDPGAQHARGPARRCRTRSVSPRPGSGTAPAGCCCGSSCRWRCR